MVGRDRASQCDMAASETEIPPRRSTGASASWSTNSTNHSSRDDYLKGAPKFGGFLYRGVAKGASNPARNA
jgi:hypothetical protein